MLTGWCVRTVLGAVLGVLLLPVSSMRAQVLYGVPHLRNSAYLGLGYVASIPEMFVGVSALGLTPKVLGGAGLYAEVKLSATSPSHESFYDPTITVGQAQSQFGDFLLEQRSVWVAVDAAFVYALTRELAAYAGGGYSREHHYREYYDDTQTRGFQGFYWIRDPAASGGRLNAVGGILIRASRYVLFRAGLNARPGGADVGVTFTLPLR